METGAIDQSFFTILIRQPVLSFFIHNLLKLKHTKGKGSDLMKQAQTKLLYALNFTVFLSISIVNTQMLPLLKKLDYNVVERGYILAGSAVIAIVGQFLFGYLCDRFKRTKPFFYLAYLWLLIASIMMFLKTGKLFFYHFSAASVILGMVKVIMGMAETWMLEIQEDCYGKLRAFGALGFTLGSPLTGMLVKTLGYRSLLYGCCIVAGLAVVFIYAVNDKNKKSTQPFHKSDVITLIKNKDYCLLVCIFLFIYMIGTADQYVVVDKLLSLDATNTQIGIKWAVQSFMEIPLFLGANRILKKWKIHQLLVFGTGMYILKFVLYGYFSEPLLLILTSALQLVTLPIVMLTSKLFIKAVTPQHLFHSAQMFAMAVFVGGSGLITPIITSYVANRVGYDMTLYLTAAFGILPLALIAYYHRHQNVDKKG